MFEYETIESIQEWANENPGFTAIIIFIGYLMIIWDGKKQGMHDKIVGTYVVKTS